MIKKMFFGTLFFVSLVFTSCSDRIVGTWNVDRYDVSGKDNRGFSASNAGTIKFNKNGSGEKNFEYNSISGSKDKVIPFTWKSNGENLFTLSGVEDEFSKTWIVVENKKKFQKWKSTNGGNVVQTIELTKK